MKHGMVSFVILIVALWMPATSWAQGLEINNRSDIVTTGEDSRDPTVRLTYFLTLSDE